MSLYLCGGGSGKQIKEAYNDFKKQLDKHNFVKPILYIPLAMEKENYNDCKKWFNEEVKYFGDYSYEMVSSSFKLAQKELSNYSAVFIGGGNTYKLLKELRTANFLKKIKKYLQNDGLVFACSAGAIIFGKDIDCCKIDDPSQIMLEDTQGLNLINDYSILCHLSEKKLNNNISYLKEYSKKYKVLYLPEELVIKIDKNQKALIGKKEYIVFIDGNYNYHNSTDFQKNIV